MNRKNRVFWKRVVQSAGFVAVCAMATAVSAGEEQPVERPAAGEVAILRGLLGLQYPSLILSNSMPVAEVRPPETQVSVSAIPARELN